MSDARILIVEDELLLAADLADHLESMGYRVIEQARTGEEAIRMAKEFHPSLVLMDIVLRKGGMDGIEAAMEIKSHVDAAIVYVTAHTEADLFSRARASDPFGFVTKPFSASDLCRTVETALYKHEMETRLRRSEERLRSILASIRDWVVVVDQAGQVIECHQPGSGSEGLGMTSKKLLGRHYSEVMPGDAAEMLEMALEKVAVTGEVQSFDYAAGKPGNQLWFSAKVSMLRGTRGEFTGATIVARDITDRKRMEDALRGSRDRMSKILDSISDGFLSLDESGRVTYFNRQAEKWLGCKSDQVIGRIVSDVFGDAGHPMFQENYAHAQDNMEPASFQIQCSSSEKGLQYDVRIYPYAEGVSVFFQRKPRC